MAYLKVLVPGRENQDIDVLINKRKNGKVGKIIVLDDGYVKISVDLPNAEEKTVNIKNTAEDRPRVVKIKCPEEAV